MQATLLPSSGRLRPLVGSVMLLICALVISFVNASFAQETRAAHSELAVVQAGVQQSEDAPFVPADYVFLPGDYLYFTFQIAGFSIQSSNRDEVQKISLTYQAAPEDANGVPLTKPVSDSIQAELSSEDKNWTPKRRASFLLPSYVASGDFRVHLVIKDEFGKAEVSKDFPFHIGGVHIQQADSINVQQFQFLRRENDRDALEIPAYSPGDTVFARFDMAGFKLAPGNAYALEYGLSVTQPKRKTFSRCASGGRVEIEQLLSSPVSARHRPHHYAAE